MKLTSAQLLDLRKALMAGKLAGLDSIVFANDKVAGLHEGHTAAVFSDLKLLEPGITMGIVRLGELDKRLALFGDDVLVELEIADSKNVRRLAIKKGSSKIDFRCTAEKLITYPKTNTDDAGIFLTFTKPEVAMLSKGAKTLGAEQLTLQVKRDGTVHIECKDKNGDSFEIDLETPAAFAEDAYGYVNPFDVSSGGVFLPLLEHMVKDADTADLVIMKTGNIGMTAYGHHVIAIPRIQHGE